MADQLAKWPIDPPWPKKLETYGKQDNLHWKSRTICTQNIPNGTHSCSHTVQKRWQNSRGNRYPGVRWHLFSEFPPRLHLAHHNARSLWQGPRGSSPHGGVLLSHLAWCYEPGQCARSGESPLFLNASSPLAAHEIKCTIAQA